MSDSFRLQGTALHLIIQTVAVGTPEDFILHLLPPLCQDFLPYTGCISL